MEGLSLQNWIIGEKFRYNMISIKIKHSGYMVSVIVYHESILSHQIWIWEKIQYNMISIKIKCSE